MCGRPRPAVLVAGAITLLLLLTSCGGSTPEPPAGSRTFRIPTTGGEELDAVEAGTGDDVVVLSHGATGTKEDFYELAGAFAEDGWRAIVYSARSDHREDDLRAVVGYARRTGATSVVLGGGSLGASLSIAMAHELDAAAIVSLSAPASAFDALQAAEAIGDRVPAFVAAAQDNEPYTSDAKRIADAFRVEPVIVSGSGHGSGVIDDHPELLTTIVGFADRAIDRG